MVTIFFQLTMLGFSQLVDCLICHFIDMKAIMNNPYLCQGVFAMVLVT